MNDNLPILSDIPSNNNTSASIAQNRYSRNT